MKGISLLFILCFAAASSTGQSKPRNVKQEITWMKNALMQYHVEPKAIDDSFSADLFQTLLEDLDPDKIYFTNADLASLESYQHSLDDEVNGKDTGFLNRLKEQYRSGLVRAEKSITAMLASPLDWGLSETYQPEGQRCATDKELLIRQRQWLKYQVLDRLAELKERDSATSTADFFARNIAAATSHIQFAALRPIKRLLSAPGIVDQEVSNAFLRGMAAVFDPHSTFFSTTDYDNFVGSLSTEDYYFGFMLDEDDKGNVVISALAPGGAAWKSGALHVSDVLLAVKWQNEDKVDLTGMNIDDVNDILSANESGLLEMTIRGVDGNERQVTLRKEKISSEQDVVQSFVLHGDITVGYIYLPDFYTRWDDEQEGGRCANDVAKEIIRLKREGIDGIILDLRFNGGGSLFEARAMAGIFIDEGPLAMVTTRDKKPVTLKDMNRGTVYDGPLVLMVNGQSASASEVLAGCIQDYNRGLIVGSATYGKATGQNVFPIEGMTVETPKKGQPGAGYVKITTQKLFRVTGKSVQSRGITPDVTMPDIFSALNLSERRYPFALQRDSIPVNPYFKPLRALRRRELQELSANRLASNPAFRELEKTISWLEQEMANSASPKPLDWEKYLALMQEQDEQQASVDGFKSPDKVYEVSNGQTKEQQLAFDDYARELNHRWLDVLTSDIYLQETYRVLRDHISLTKKP